MARAEVITVERPRRWSAADKAVGHRHVAGARRQRERGCVPARDASEPTLHLVAGDAERSLGQWLGERTFRGRRLCRGRGFERCDFNHARSDARP